ncbi:MAG: hypothetical protein A2020_01650 [Lentisphaerae bacterium GWF2_45_14]|nr:MAG: hypothetical protein A2020_01650 [Lentisphaerae bacterium GWF2_45_14]
MIVPMKKVTVLCLGHDTESVLSKIRELGMMHVEAGKLSDSKDRAELQSLFSSIEKADGCLTSIKASAAAPAGNVDGKELFSKVQSLQNEFLEIEKKIDKQKRLRDQLTPWGDFSQELISNLRSGGISVYLCEVQDKSMADELLTRKDISVEFVKSPEKGKILFAVFSLQPLDPSTLPLAAVPEGQRLSQVKSEIEADEKRVCEIESELSRLAAARKELLNYKEEVGSHLAFASARDSMQSHDEYISSLRGYIPAEDADRLTSSARENGWAVVVNEPSNDDWVPTLVKIPKMFRMIKPFFDFLGISPGYDEIDASVCILFFFTVFFGMIVGDGGYGLLLFAATLFAKFKFRKNPAATLPVNLFLVLSLATVTWGALTGTWFGTQHSGIKWLQQQSNIQAFCFGLAIAQLTVGHVWQALVSRNIRKVLGHLGWSFFLWGNFILIVRLLAYPGPMPSAIYYLYGAGGVLIVLFDIDWLHFNIAEVFNLPFSLIGSFVDILSYIRLFAVGMAGFCIANSFNGMGISMMKLSPWLIVVGVIILLVGHALNFALCLMGVLVHGVRLNALEFSNHIGLKWGGIEFNPFKLNKNNYNITEGEIKNGNE